MFTVSLLVVILTLFSCSTGQDAPPPPEINSAADLLAAIDLEMSELKSYKIDSNIDMIIYAQKTKMAISGSMVDILSTHSADDCYVYSKANLTYVINEKDVAFCEDLNAYYNGNAFVSAVVDQQERKLYSPMSSEDFLEYYEYLSSVSVDNVDIYDCQNPTYTQNENGSWDVLLAGYSEEFISDYVGSMGFFDEALDQKVVDMEISIKTNSKFRVAKMTLDFIFEDDENPATTPKVNLVMYFSQYDEAEIITDDLNVENYNEVADVRLVDGIDHMMDAIKDSENGELALMITQSIGKSFHTENDSISYGKEDGKYYYDIHSAVGADITYDISYRDGEVTLTTEVRNGSTVIDSSTMTNKQTDAEAKSSINGLIDSVGYDPMYVSDIEKCEDGRYKVSLLPTTTNVSSYKSLVSSELKGSYEGSTHVIYFTILDGSIVKMESEIVIEYSYWNGISSAIGEVIFTAMVELA